MHILNETFPCRKNQIDQLYNFYIDQSDSSALFVHGLTGTGKTNIVCSFLKALDIKFALVNLIECYTSKLLFESILNRLADFSLDPSDGAPFATCDNFDDFTSNLKRIDKVDEAVIVLDNAEELRTMPFNLLPGFLKLQEITGSNLKVILISELVFERFLAKSGGRVPAKLHFPQYNMEELLKILRLDYKIANELVVETYPDIATITEDFYEGYLKSFLLVFYRVCRELPELRYQSMQNFVPYCTPVAKNECEITNTITLWRNISPVLKSALEGIYLRIATNIENKDKEENDKKEEEIEDEDELLSASEEVELPFKARYLLIAAYLASFNPAKADKRLFVKHHGKKTKTLKDIKTKSKVSEKLNTQLGPKSFTFERFIAIFFALYGEKCSFSGRFLSIIATLVDLNFLVLSADCSNMEARKYTCCVDFPFIEEIAKTVGLDIKKYLVDFN